MMEESPQQFKDTISLFDYGFSNFSSVTASKEDTTYQVKNGDLFANTFNQSNILSIDPDAKVPSSGYAHLCRSGFRAEL